MIEIAIYKNAQQNIMRYIIDGHANYANKGEDIVCAAVSVLAQTTLMSLKEVIKIKENKLNYHIDNEKGYLKVELLPDISEDKLRDAQIVLKTLIVGLESIIIGYPEYITLEYGEV